MDTVKNLLNDLRVELMDEFDRNFERKAFFDDPWPARRFDHGRGTLMAVTGRLRRSPRCQVVNDSLVFSSNVPYFNLHNKGGTITVTPRMRKYFWAMYYLNGGGIKGMQPPATALAWRNLALTKKERFRIPKRQMIGHHAQVDAICQRQTDKHIRRWATEYFEPRLKKIIKP